MTLTRTEIKAQLAALLDRPDSDVQSLREGLAELNHKAKAAGPEAVNWVTEELEEKLATVGRTIGELEARVKDNKTKQNKLSSEIENADQVLKGREQRINRFRETMERSEAFNRRVRDVMGTAGWHVIWITVAIGALSYFLSK